MNFCTYPESKSDEKANKYRDEGNAKFKRKDFMNSLLLYNKSICYARSKILISLAYANRSAAYFEIKSYPECLKNIEWARSNGYPRENKKKLDERELRCIFEWRCQKMPENPMDFFKLSYPANEKIPWIVDCVEMRFTEKYGRGIYANRDLKPGDIISIEEPPVSLLVGDSYYRHCANCYQTCMMNLIPCIRTASMMFCSQECMRQLYSKAFNFCSLLCDDVKFLSEIAAGFDGLKEFNEFAKTTDLRKLNKTIFDYDFSDPTCPDYRKNIAMCLLSLTSYKPDFLNDKTKLNSRELVSNKTLEHVLGIYDINKYHSPCVSHKNVFLGRNFVPLFHSLINHSCVFHTNIIPVDNRVITIVMRPVKAGEQIFTTYLDSYDDGRKMALKSITKQYKFVCDCPGCKDPNYKFNKYTLFEIAEKVLNREKFDKSRELLENGFKIMNEQDCEFNMYCFYEIFTFSILTTIAYYSTFPV